MRRRVVVSGLGMVCALGEGVEAGWANLLRGRDGVGPVTGFDSSGHRTHVAAHSEGMRRQGSVHAMTRLAYREAWEASAGAGLVGAPPPERRGLGLGLLGGDAIAVEEQMMRSPEDRAAAVGPATSGWYEPDSIARSLARDAGVEGPVATLANACSAGNHAIAAGVDWIRSGRAEWVLAGGMGVVSFTGFTHFDNLRSLSPDRCRPFDRFRRGLVLGDGAACLVLEDREAAERRGAHIHAEVLGYGLSCDAHNVAAPHPEGRGAIAAMRRALDDAGRDVDEVDYVSAHGTGTRANDPVEARAVIEVFGERGRHLPCSSIKSMIGHTLGGASALEAVVCCRAIEDGAVPPTINFEEPDPDCPIDCVPNEARTTPVRVAVNNAFAFGGNNCTVVFGASR